MEWVTLAALVCAVISGYEFFSGVSSRSFAPLALGVFLMSLAIALVGLGILPTNIA